MSELSSSELSSQALDVAARRIAQKRMAANANPVSSFNTGVNKTLISIAGFPMDVANGALNLIGLGSELPVKGGSEHLTRLAEEAGLVNEPGRPVTGFERGGIVVGASLPGFGAVGTAARLGRTGGIFRPMVESFKAAPGKTAVIETVSAGGAATVGEAGRQLAEGNEEIGQVIGEIIGGISTPSVLMIATKLPMVKLVEKITRPLRPKSQKKIVGGILEEATGDRTLALAKKPEFIPLEGTKFTLGEKLSDQNLITLEQAVAKKVPALADDMVKNRIETNRAIFKALNEGQVPGVDTKDRTVQLFQSIKSRLKTAMDARMAGAIKRTQDRVNLLRAKGERPDISKVLNSEIEDALSDARLQERFNWNLLDEKADITLRHSKEAMDRFIGEQTQIPQFVRNFLDFDELKTVGFKEVKEFRTNVLQIQQQARTMGRADISFFLQKVNEGVLDDIANSSLSDDFGLAVDFSRELNKRFTRGRIGKALRFTSRGGKAVEATSFSEELFPSNPIKASEGFEASLAATAPMPGGQVNRQRNVVAAVEDLLKTRLFDTAGDFNETAAKSMLTKKGEFLNNFPQLRVQIQSAIGNLESQQALANRLKGARASLKDKNKTALALITNSRPDQFMKKIMSSPNRKRLLSQAVRTTKKRDMAAFHGLQESYMDGLTTYGTTGATNEAGERVISGIKLEEYFNATIKDAIDSGLWDKDQASRLLNIIKNAKQFEAAGTDAARIAKLLEDKTSFLTDFITRVIGAGIGGRVSKKLIGEGTLVAQSAGSKISRKIAESLPQESLIEILGHAVRNEQLYKDLMEIDISEPLDSRQIQRIHSWLMGMGIEQVIPQEQ